MEIRAIGTSSSLPAEAGATASETRVAASALPASGPRDEARPATDVHDEVRVNDPMHTNWGFGPRENQYNGILLDALHDRWTSQPPLPPMILKSLVAQESAFDPQATSRSGYVGLMQLGRAEAQAQGLSLEPVDERAIPEKNVPAGLGVLGIKHGVLRDPLSHYDTPFAHSVADYYRDRGMPSDRQTWYLTLAAYNGGGGTVLRAMATAIDRNVDPREWSNLVGAPNDIQNSPLYLAIKDVYPQNMWMTKYREMSQYPVGILRRAGAL